MHDGDWETPFGDLDIRDMAAHGDTLVVAGATADRAAEVRTARLDGGRLVESGRMDVPYPPACDEIPRPWLSLDASGPRLALAINLEEYQGGSWGVVVIPDLAGDHRETIDNAEQASDIAFAAPLLLRGDTLLTRGPWALRRFERTAPGRWTERQVFPNVDDTSVEWGWALALSPSGRVWMTSRGPHLVILEQRRSGTFEIACELPLEHEPTAIVFLGEDEALVGTSSAWRDGTSIRQVRRTGPGWAWGRALTIPPDPHGWAVSGVEVHGQEALITQQDAAWRMSLVTGHLAPLELPPRTGRHHREPQAQLLGHHPVLRVGNQLRVLAPWP